MIFNNIIICNNINNLIYNFKNYNSILNFKSDLNYYLNNKYIIGESILYDNCFFIRIWKSKVLNKKILNKLDLNKNIICCFDYIITDNSIKILYTHCNDDNIFESIIKYIENIALMHNINIIIYDFNKLKLNHNNDNIFIYKDSNFL